MRLPLYCICHTGGQRNVSKQTLLRKRTVRQMLSQPNSSSIFLTSPSTVFSIRPLTLLANSASVSFSRWAVIIGVLIVLLALMISLILIENIKQNSMNYKK